MSHFLLAVISQDYLRRDELESILQPYHQYECTGIDDEYVVDVDVTEEFEKEFTEHKERCAKNGTPVKPIDEFAEYNGYFHRDGRYYHHTNPNYKWDWWKPGGRYSKWLRLKPTPDSKEPRYSDGARIRDINIAGMREEARKAALAVYDAYRSVVPPGTEYETYVSVKKRTMDNGRPTNDTRKIYEGQKSRQLVKNYEGPDSPQLREVRYFPKVNDAIETSSREAYGEAAAKRAFTPFAYLKDGKWVERGRMGWFGIVMDEQNTDAWAEHFCDVLNGLPDDAVITVIDCHI